MLADRNARKLDVYTVETVSTAERSEQYEGVKRLPGMGLLTVRGLVGMLVGREKPALFTYRILQP